MKDAKLEKERRTELALPLLEFAAKGRVKSALKDIANIHLELAKMCKDLRKETKGSVGY